jgi:hypothetical protein
MSAAGESVQYCSIAGGRLRVLDFMMLAFGESVGTTAPPSS